MTDSGALPPDAYPSVVTLTVEQIDEKLDTLREDYLLWDALQARWGYPEALAEQIKNYEWLRGDPDASGESAL